MAGTCQADIVQRGLAARRVRQAMMDLEQAALTRDT
jgi:hypothetical protein